MTTSKKANTRHGNQIPSIVFDADWKGPFMVTGEFVIRDPRIVTGAQKLMRTNSAKKGKPKALSIRA
jgi:hypothetical protein